MECEILIDLLAKQISQGQAKATPTSYFFNGVCLLVDISGFTKLSCALCVEGKSGIDGLQLATNGYMGKLVETIYMFGGDIIKFAGDAILCIFPTALVTKLVKTKRGNIVRRSMNDSILSTRDLAGSSSDSIRGVADLVKDESRQSSESGSVANDGAIRPDLLLRAMHCAETLKKVTYESLTAHVAISCGEMCFGVLGGHADRWECLISGPCIHELSACLDEAPSMQAVMTAGCFDVLRRHQRNLCLVAPISSPTEMLNGLSGYKYALAELESGNVTIASIVKTDVDPAVDRRSCPPSNPKRRIQDDALAGLIMQFLPPIIVSGIKQGTGLSYIAEIREVTTMFMKWDSYDANVKHRDLILFQDCLYAVQRVLHNTGAYLRQFLVDDKGCVLIACWGMPSQTYLDNAHRALTAAVEIRAALLQLQMTCSFGITTGDVYCGTVGSALRMEYAAIGSVVNMAARLMGKAHGGILIDEACFLRLPVASQSAMVQLPRMWVKGRVEPMHVYEHCGVPAGLVVVEAPANYPQHGMLEVRDCCREPLTTLLDRLTGVHINVRKNSSINALHSTFGSFTPPGTPRTITTLSSVLLQGTKGLGCTASTAWLYKQAQERSVCTAFVKVADKAYLCPFHVLHKIFAQLAPKDLYRSDTCQRQYVHAILKEVYPDDADTAFQVAFPIMKLALGITCANGRHRGNNCSSVRTDPTFPARTMTVVLTTIFKHLLTERTVLVIIDDIHNADEESLRVLVELLKIDSRSAIVMTAVSSFDTVVAAGKDLTNVVGNANDHTGWVQRIRPVILSNRSTLTITVGVFTATEIAAMLATLPESANFPPHLPTLVQTLSGGELALINEIIRFVREFGAEQLLSIVGEPAPKSPQSGKRTPPNMSPRQSITASVRKRLSASPSPQRSPCNSLRASNDSNEQRRGLDTAFGVPVVPAEGFKIDQLVVCRYEKLRLSTKQILRTASIIGRTFSRQVLYGVLPRSLKGEVTNGLHTLVQHQWVQFTATDDDVELYEFRYEYAHQIVYNITPESERHNLHKVIADYIEEISAGDPAQAPQLCYHYGKCDYEKALYYTYVAAAHLLDYNTPLDLCRAVCATNRPSTPPTRIRLSTFFFCCIGRRNAVIVPDYGVVEQVHAHDEEDAYWHSELGNVLTRNYFVSMLRQLECELEQRRLHISTTTAGQGTESSRKNWRVLA